MPPLTDTALCLRRWEYSETSQTVRLFTREHGVLRGLAKGARRERSRFSGGFEVLTRGQVVAYVKAGRDLATVAEWAVTDLHRVFRHNLAANRAGLLVVDLLSHFLTDHDPHPELYDQVVSELERMATPALVTPALLAATWAILTETGYRPELDQDVVAGTPLPAADVYGFAPRHGGLVADPAHPGAWGVRHATVARLRALAAGEPVEEADDATERAARLLGMYAREIAGQDLPGLPWCWPGDGLPSPG